MAVNPIFAPKRRRNTPQDEKRIRTLAYFLSLERTRRGRPSDADADWIEAEDYVLWRDPVELEREEILRSQTAYLAYKLWRTRSTFGKPGTADGDWFTAEKSIRFSTEVDDLKTAISQSRDPDERLRFICLVALAEATRIRPDDINFQTPLPERATERSNIMNYVRWTIGYYGNWTPPEPIATFGQLVEAAKLVFSHHSSGAR